jgi:excisionase family DNA binding protein
MSIEITKIFNYKRSKIMRNENQKLPHVDSIRNAAADFGIGEWTIRQWVKQKKFPVVMSGRKILINYDIFTNFLNGGSIETKDEG